MSLAEPISIAHRFRGPAGSGNGGYTAGRLAVAVLLADGDAPEQPDPRPVTATLRKPPPLEVAMTVGLDADGGSLWSDGKLVATAALRPDPAFGATPPAPVSTTGAEAAEASYRGALNHPFPGCFVCGTARAPGDGLRLAPGLLAPGHTACVWRPDGSLLARPGAGVGPEFVWSALDCPGGWTSDLENRPMVLGRMTAQCLSVPEVGAAYVVVGRLLGEEGRKTFTATAMYDGDRLVGRAEHTWIAIDPEAFQARPPHRE